MPNDPPGYTGPQECTWKITVPAGNTIAVMINNIKVSNAVNGIKYCAEAKPNGSILGNASGLSSDLGNTIKG